MDVIVLSSHTQHIFIIYMDWAFWPILIPGLFIFRKFLYQITSVCCILCIYGAATYKFHFVSVKSVHTPSLISTIEHPIFHIAAPTTWKQKLLCRDQIIL
jgi:hypothetical protein